jgi:hypothetical protein
VITGVPTLIPGVRRLIDCLRQNERAFAFRRAFMEATGSNSAREWGVNGALHLPLVDAVELFEELRIGYALIGATAAMVYGRARFTEDVDFVADSGHQKTLAEHSEVMRRHHFDPNCTWKLYHDSGAEIDIWKDEFSDQIAARAQVVPLQDKKIRIAEVHDLIAMKLRANRPQDDYDISEIIRQTRLDENLLAQRVTAEQFGRYLNIKTRVQA